MGPFIRAGRFILPVFLYLNLIGCPVPVPGWAQSCGSEYTVKEGESLADIASRAYGASSQWTLIFYANQDRMGGNASMLVPGLKI